MIPLRVPDWLRQHQIEYEDYKEIDPNITRRIREGLQQFYPDDSHPDVTIIMPVWNEELNILRTLSSIAAIRTKYKTELILVNNNSTDRTTEILNELGVFYIDEPKQGISFARQRGLKKARGRIIINADGDSYYPPAWLDNLASWLDDHPDASVVHSTYAFIPPANRRRLHFALYEVFVRLAQFIRGKKRAYLHVYGFNFAFRREQAWEVGGFDTTRVRWSDGVLAFDLLPYGDIYQLKNAEACVWTIPRRVLQDGGLLGGLWVRAKKEFGRFGDYVFRREVKR